MGITFRKLQSTTTLRVVVLAAFAIIGGFGVVQQVQAAQTPVNYCNQYPPDSGEVLMRSACYDGLKIADGKGDGASCQDYILLADQATVEICNKALNERTATKSGAADIVSEGERPEETPSPTPSASPSPSSSPSSGGSFQDILDETKNLSEYIDVLHEAGPDKDADMDSEGEEYQKYINGAGNKQDILVDPSGKDNSPAIIIMNGGGWQANDQNDDKIRDNVPDLNKRTQTGPTAKQRGYTVFELTYRLGSSGVYYMFEDVMRGIKHVRDNAEMYNIDPNRIAIWGDSSGGSLATRAGASGKSGAKVAVGWSPPTNAYTGLFRSYKSLMIGMDHSTCVPTDLAGLTNITDLINGGAGDVAEYGKGLSSNGFNDFIGSGGSEPDSISIIMQVLTAGQYALKTGQNLESISTQLEAAYNNGEPTISSISGSGLSSGIINMSSKKLIECIDNFNALSPALFASPESTPMFLAGFSTDDVVGPEQVTGMHDKLQSLGIKSDYKIMPGTDMGSQPLGPNPGNHLDYDARFVCPTLNFIDSIIQPDASKTNCDTGQTENLGSAPVGDGAAGGGGGGSGANAEGGGGTKTASNPATEKECAHITKQGQLETTYQGTCGKTSETGGGNQEANCKNNGGTYTPDRRGDGNTSCILPTSEKQDPYEARAARCPSGSSPALDGSAYCLKSNTWTDDASKARSCSGTQTRSGNKVTCKYTTYYSLPSA